MLYFLISLTSSFPNWIFCSAWILKVRGVLAYDRSRCVLAVQDDWFAVRTKNIKEEQGCHRSAGWNGQGKVWELYFYSGKNDILKNLVCFWPMKRNSRVSPSVALKRKIRTPGTVSNFTVAFQGLSREKGDIFNKLNFQSIQTLSHITLLSSLVSSAWVAHGMHI